MRLIGTLEQQVFVLDPESYHHHVTCRGLYVYENEMDVGVSVAMVHQPLNTTCWLMDASQLD